MSGSYRPSASHDLELGRKAATSVLSHWETVEAISQDISEADKKKYDDFFEKLVGDEELEELDRAKALHFFRRSSLKEPVLLQIVNHVIPDQDEDLDKPQFSIIMFVIQGVLNYLKQHQGSALAKAKSRRGRAPGRPETDYVLKLSKADESKVRAALAELGEELIALSKAPEFQIETVARKLRTVEETIRIPPGSSEGSHSRPRHARTNSGGSVTDFTPKRPVPQAPALLKTISNGSDVFSQVDEQSLHSKNPSEDHQSWSEHDQAVHDFTTSMFGRVLSATSGTEEEPVFRAAVENVSATSLPPVLESTVVGVEPLTSETAESTKPDLTVDTKLDSDINTPVGFEGPATAGVGGMSDEEVQRPQMVTRSTSNVKAAIAVFEAARKPGTDTQTLPRTLSKGKHGAGSTAGSSAPSAATSSVASPVAQATATFEDRKMFGEAQDTLANLEGHTKSETPSIGVADHQIAVKAASETVPAGALQSAMEDTLQVDSRSTSDDVVSTRKEIEDALSGIPGHPEKPAAPPAISADLQTTPLPAAVSDEPKSRDFDPGASTAKNAVPALETSWAAFDAPGVPPDAMAVPVAVASAVAASDPWADETVATADPPKFSPSVWEPEQQAQPEVAPAPAKPILFDSSKETDRAADTAPEPSGAAEPSTTAESSKADPWAPGPADATSNTSNKPEPISWASFSASPHVEPSPPSAASASGDPWASATDMPVEPIAVASTASSSRDLWASAASFQVEGTLASDPWLEPNLKTPAVPVVTRSASSEPWTTPELKSTSSLGADPWASFGNDTGISKAGVGGFDEHFADLAPLGPAKDTAKEAAGSFSDGFAPQVPMAAAKAASVSADPWAASDADAPSRPARSGGSDTAPPTAGDLWGVAPASTGKAGFGSSFGSSGRSKEDAGFLDPFGNTTFAPTPAPAAVMDSWSSSEPGSATHSQHASHANFDSIMNSSQRVLQTVSEVQVEGAELLGWEPMQDAARIKCEQAYDDKFAQAGGLSREDAADFCTRANLDAATTQAIWAAADVDKDGRLNKQEFCLLMLIIQQVRNGADVPASIPRDQIPRLLGVLSNPPPVRTQSLQRNPIGRTTSLTDQDFAGFGSLSQQMKDLLNLGFSMEQAKVALDANGGDMEKAARALLAYGPQNPTSPTASQVLPPDSKRVVYGAQHSMIAPANTTLIAATGDEKPVIQFSSVLLGYKKNMEQPFVTVSLRDADGKVLEKSQDTPPGSYNTKEHVLMFNHSVTLATPLTQIPAGSTIFFEVKHYKSKEKKISIAAWSFLPTGLMLDYAEFTPRLKVGPLQLPLYQKPLDVALRKLKRINPKAKDMQIVVGLTS